MGDGRSSGFDKMLVSISRGLVGADDTEESCGSVTASSAYSSASCVSRDDLGIGSDDSSANKWIEARSRLEDLREGPDDVDGSG